LSDNARVIVIACVGVALVAGAFRLPSVARSTYRSVADGFESTAQRELAPAGQVQIPDDVLVQAARTIPRTATVVGPGSPTPAYLEAGIPQFLRYWLLPRKYVSDVRQAQWVILYGHAPGLHEGVARSIAVAPSVRLVEVRR
jgi:hypothetical protein